ncbi:MAG: COX15/CtaA family protein [Actinomycetes bacterium]
MRTSPTVPPAGHLAGLRRLGLAAIATNVLIVVTGGVVRVTGSGLGCPDWPTCTGSRVVPAAGGEQGWHQFVEFGNRTLTFLVLGVAVALWLAVRRAGLGDRTLERLALWLPVGVLAQAVLGGLSVLLRLEPLVVASHFLLSMVLIAIATSAHHRVVLLDRPDVPAGRAAGAGRRDDLVVATAWLPVLAAVVLVVGTLVTASGPHAGDPGTARLPLDIREVARVHSTSVWLTVALSVGILVAARRRGWDALARAAGVLVAVEVAQGTVGYAQYATGIPPSLVTVHLLLACVFWVAVLRVALIGAGGPPAADAPAAGADDARPAAPVGA